jgi:hypothetical protein
MCCPNDIKEYELLSWQAFFKKHTRHIGTQNTASAILQARDKDRHYISLSALTFMRSYSFSLS